MALVVGNNCPPAAEWAQHKDVLHKWYIEQDQTLKQVQEAMEPFFGSRAKKSDFERYFKQWGFKKNLKKSEWLEVGRTVEKRKRDGKLSDVYLNGHALPSKKVRKELLRNYPRTVAKKMSQGSWPWSNCLNSLDEPHLGCSPILPAVVRVSTPPFLEAKTRVAVIHDLPYLQLGSMLTNMWFRLSASGQFSGTITSLSAAASPTVSLEYNVLEALSGWSQTLSWSVMAREAQRYTDHFPPMLRSENDVLMDLQRVCYMFSNRLQTKTFNVWYHDESIVDALTVFDNDLFLSGLRVILKSSASGMQSFSEALSCSAIRYGNLRIVQICLAAKLNPNRLTPYWAARYKSDQLRSDRSDSWTLTLLALAVASCRTIMRYPEASRPQNPDIQSRFLAIIKELIDAGADVDGRCAHVKEWGGPMMLALKYNQASVVSLLLRHGARCDQHFTAVCGQSALCVAFSNQASEQTVEQLLQHGADTAGNDLEYGRTCLENAFLWHQDRCDYEPPGSIDRDHACDSFVTGHLSFIRVCDQLLESGVGVDAHIHRGSIFDPIRNALSIACRSNCLPMTKYLCERGAGLSAEATIFAASAPGGDSVLQYLSRHQNADPSAISDGMSALTYAIKSGCPEKAQLLLSWGASPNPPVTLATSWKCMEDRRAPTPLQAACMQNYVDIVSRLINLGADVNAPSSSIFQPSGERIWFETNEDIWFEEYEDEDHTALTAAAKSGNLVVVNLLLDAGAKVDQSCESTNQTPLSIALSHDNAAIVERLLAAGCSETQTSALHTAIKLRKKDMISRIIANGADVNALIYDSWIDGEGQSPLDVAIANDDLDTVRLLLQAGAETERPEMGLRIFELASEQVTETLLNAHLARHGAIQPCFGAKILLACMSNGYKELFQLSLRRGIDPNYRCCARGEDLVEGARYSMLHYCLDFDTNRMFFVTKLLEAGADPNVPVYTLIEASVTALSFALSNWWNDMVPILLEAGADVNVPANIGMVHTALQAACEQGSMQMVEQLLAAGADVNQAAGPTLGVTALQIAAVNGHIEIVRLLIARGANVNAPGCPEEGRTALEGAAEYGRLDITQMLLNAGAQTHGHPQFDNAVKFAAQNGHMALCDLILAHHALTDPEMEAEVQPASDGSHHPHDRFSMGFIDDLDDEQNEESMESEKLFWDWGDISC